MPLSEDQFQYYMFAPAGDLAGLKFEDQLPGEPREFFVDRKLNESKLPGSADSTYAAMKRQADPDGPSLHESLKEHPVVHEPVALHSGTPDDPDTSVLNGHHRIIALDDVKPDAEVPIRWVK